ncbi:hypothetical protein GLOIN_2v1712998 [Rhizophagus irregularis DAOM 181602=DAOM 197198]|uniref:Uncharacterized protein n=1 Tax=Rhizophagus irregularis (strain DAOM 181602 / DAOM 197198 / MUCL 43194) TaxID=747089 RepID=A0A2P4P502_RHIID|nr:hypothetical protein GLOIN_2v1712998 [Rhizophagus irregularis DAOM 181602=DAOM 197198]POG60465.1 hypothetical protein GLOIN_2v1712998 [Rhizophagus irregularis DAOM 181602=DAOM 197198]|eukprot:XP_025167331.1 hypothetical protein GLOIN_2v1712998 [Rhizophagus irregularis DAOM 181602=DAOM 197198]
MPLCACSHNTIYIIKIVVPKSLIRSPLLLICLERTFKLSQILRISNLNIAWLPFGNTEEVFQTFDRIVYSARCIFTGNVSFCKTMNIS